MENPEGLPSHYRFFTSLIDSLSNRAPPQQASNDDARTTATTDREELTAKEHNRRKLLLTLHVLFPSLLLPALDLLDRNLVTRIRLGPAGSDVSQDGPAGTMPLYVVRSVASTISSNKRRPRTGGADLLAAARSYVVRLASWNCTCASFTFDAFPPMPTARAGAASASASAAAGRENASPESWSSGGLSLDGMTGDAPCCKHLLACLLAERWVSSHEGFLQTRHVTKDELAGLVAGV